MSSAELKTLVLEYYYDTQNHCLKTLVLFIHVNTTALAMNCDKDSTESSCTNSNPVFSLYGAFRRSGQSVVEFSHTSITKQKPPCLKKKHLPGLNLNKLNQG